MKYAYFAGGCFWCITPVFAAEPGVISVVSGYCGGDEEDPSYEDVKAQRTGHRETVRVEYDNLDQYGRILGIIFLGDTDINLQMVRDGCAWHYKHFDNTPAYAEAEREAQAAKRGLWASGTAINPYEWRKENKRR